MPTLIGPQYGRVIGPQWYPLQEDGGAITLPADARDGPLNVYRPYYPEYWPLIAPGIEEPDYLWDMQTTSGNLVDIANGPGGVLTANANTAYQQITAGWNARSVGVTAEATGSGFYAPVGQLWDIGAQSVLVLFYAAVTASNGNRCLWLGGGNNGLQIQTVAAGQASSFVSGATVGTFVYESASPIFYPFAYTWDRRATTISKLTTNKEEVVSTWTNLSDNFKGFGSPTLAAPVYRVNLAAVWVGARAEAMIDRGAPGMGAKKLITDLAWPMAF